MPSVAVLPDVLPCVRPPRGCIFRSAATRCGSKRAALLQSRAQSQQQSGRDGATGGAGRGSSRRLAALLFGSTALSSSLPIGGAVARPPDNDEEIDKYFPSLSPSGAGVDLGADAPGAGAGSDEPLRTSTVDESVTDLVYMDIGVCPEGLRQNRTLGDKSAICSTSEPLGRIVIGLYGKQVPSTVRNFKTLMETGAYNGTIFSKVLPGEFIEAGRQGSRRMGEVAAPPELAPNEDILSPSAFRVSHNRPGTVSLALAENDDDPFVKQRSNYRPTEFLITTGPGPATFLDGQNVVFGRVVDGLETVSAVARIPTFKPAERIQSLNMVASLIGDERAAKVRAKYGRPLRSIVITDSGLLPSDSLRGVVGSS